MIAAQGVTVERGPSDTIPSLTARVGALRIYVLRDTTWTVMVLLGRAGDLPPIRVRQPETLAVQLTRAAEIIAVLRSAGVVDGQLV